ncbi:MAG: MFS transporter [Acidobacteriota bacterium]
MARVSPQEPVRLPEKVAWCLYDFGDSAFTTVIITAYYVLYFKTVVVGNPALGDWYWGLANAISALVIALVAPLLGALADQSGNKLLFLRGCAALAVTFTASLYWVRPGGIASGCILFIMANIGFSGGVIFIDAFLPEISHPGNVGRLSGYRWGTGYVGGMLSLGLVLPLVKGGFGEDHLLSARLVFPVVALWYLIWVFPAFLFLRERAIPGASLSWSGALRAGVRRLRETAGHLRHYRQLFRFLIAYWVYNDAIVTIIVFAAAYAADTLHFSLAENLLLILCVNVPAALGSLAFGSLVDRIGAKKAVSFTLILWLAVVVAAALATSKVVFLCVAALAGIGLGSCQSASRSLMSLLSPRRKAAEFFAFMGVAGKASSIPGPLLFGVLSSTTGSQRVAVLAVGLLFLAGFLILLTVDQDKGMAAAAGPGCRS